MAPGKDGIEDDDVGVLDPDELDITDDERVLEIDDGRYVIASDDESLPDDATVIEDIEAEIEETGENGEGGPLEDDEGAVSPDRANDGSARSEEIPSAVLIERMRERVDGANSLYGFDVTAKFEGDVDRRELYSNDVVTTFENLLVWFAQHIGGDTPVEEVIGILLFESNVPVRYPGIALERLVQESGLGHDAAIAELLAYAEDDQGIRFPP